MSSSGSNARAHEARAAAARDAEASRPRFDLARDAPRESFAELEDGRRADGDECGGEHRHEHSEEEHDQEEHAVVVEESEEPEGARVGGAFRGNRDRMCEPRAVGRRHTRGHGRDAAGRVCACAYMRERNSGTAKSSASAVQKSMSKCFDAKPRLTIASKDLRRLLNSGTRVSSPVPARG